MDRLAGHPHTAEHGEAGEQRSHHRFDRTAGRQATLIPAEKEQSDSGCQRSADGEDDGQQHCGRE